MSQAVRLRHRWEFSLDARQAFYLLFGAAILASLLFLLGLLIGKRLEARAANRVACGMSLDELDDFQDPDLEFTFHKVLVRKVKNPNLPPEVYETAHMDEPNPPAAGQSVGSGQDGRAVADSGRKVATSVPRPARRPAVRRARFTLQVGSFRSQAEAKALLQKLRKRGWKPYLVTSRLRGRGVWYRVRVGRFATWKESLAAKARFEKEWRKTAYVTRLR